MSYTPPMVGQSIEDMAGLENCESIIFVVLPRKMMMVLRMSLRTSISLPMVELVLSTC